MKKVFLTTVVLAISFLMFETSSQAELTQIGSISHKADEYNLIWQHDNDGTSLIWLDYFYKGDYSQSISWIEGVNTSGKWVVNLFDGYTVDWDGSWRLPSLLNNGRRSFPTDSELGRLFYSELGVEKEQGPENDAFWLADPSRNYYKGGAWSIRIPNGEYYLESADNENYALIVRDAQISAVPVPGAFWLLGSGFFGLMAVRRKKD